MLESSMCCWTVRCVHRHIACHISSALRNILNRLGNRAVEAIEACGGLDRVGTIDLRMSLISHHQIEELQQHENASVYEKAVQILEQHFGAEAGEGDDELMHHNDGNQPGVGGFQF